MKVFALSIAALLLLAGSALAVPFFDVWQDTDFDGTKDSYLGSITGYYGGLTGVANYNYYSASAHPINGPAPRAYKSKMYLYHGIDGWSFGFFHNKDASGGNYWNHVRWEIDLTNLNSNLGRVDDNVPENRGEIGIIKSGSHYDAGWAYKLNTDGGVIDDLQPTSAEWEIKIDPSMFGDMRQWQMCSGNGNHLTLWTNPNRLPDGLGGNDDYYGSCGMNAFTTFITPHVVPEPTTILLIGAGLLGGGLYARRKKII